MLLTAEEAAAELRISRASLFALLRAGDIESVLLGGRMRRIPRDALERYVQRLLDES